MKKKIVFLVMAVAVMWNACGCEMNRGTADTVSSSADDVEETGDTQTGESESGETGESTKQLTRPFVTQNCIYRLDGLNLEPHLIQSDLHGKKINKFLLEKDNNIRVSDQHICYMKGKMLYVSPIRQTDNGEEIIWEEKEKIVKKPKDLAIVEPYLIYLTDTVYRYNLNTGETLSLGTAKEFENVYFFHNNWWDLPMVYDGKIYLDGKADLDSDAEALYEIDIEEGEARKLFAYTEAVFPNVMGIRGELICVNMNTEAYYNDVEIACFNTENDSKTIVTGKEISAVLEKEGLWEEGCKEKDWEMESWFSYDDKIYMVINMSWFRKGIMKKWGEKGETEVKRTLLLSCPWNDIKDVTYEKDISEWWYSRAERNILWGEDDCFEEYSMGDIMTLYNEELYMDYSDEEGYHMVAYHMGTGTYRELHKRETEYRLMEWGLYSDYD